MQVDGCLNGPSWVEVEYTVDDSMLLGRGWKVLGLCRTGTFTDASKASVPGWPTMVVSRNPAYRAAQYDEAQEAHPAKGRFQKVASIAEDLAHKARPKPD